MNHILQITELANQERAERHPDLVATLQPSGAILKVPLLAFFQEQATLLGGGITLRAPESDGEIRSADVLAHYARVSPAAAGVLERAVDCRPTSRRAGLPEGFSVVFARFDNRALTDFK